MAVQELLAELERRKVQLVAEGERLRFRPREVVTPELREALVEHKYEVLALLGPEEQQVRWRADAMRPRMLPTGPIPPMYARRRQTPTPVGCCLSCGELLTPGNRYHCEPCVRAAWQVLHEVRGGGRT